MEEKIDEWFFDLDSGYLAEIFPGIFACYGDDEINDFIDDVYAEWDNMTFKEKSRIYDFYAE